MNGSSQGRLSGSRRLVGRGDKTERSESGAGENLNAKRRRNCHRRFSQRNRRIHQNTQAVLRRLVGTAHLAIHSARRGLGGRVVCRCRRARMMGQAAEHAAAGRSGIQRSCQKGKRRGKNCENQHDGLRAAHAQKTSTKPSRRDERNRWRRRARELPGENLRDSLTICCRSRWSTTTRTI